MARELWISATFLTGRYHGEEWPPSPARLLQAVVAGVKNGGNRRIWPTAEEGLRWLECQPPPRIYARSDNPLKKFRIAVPNNDFDVVAKDWVAGRVASASKIKTLKEVKPRQVRGTTPHLCYVWEVEDSAAERAVRLLTPAVHCLYSLGWGVDMTYADSGLSPLEAVDGLEEWVPSLSGEQRAVPVPGFLEDLESTYKRFVGRVSSAGVDADTRLRVYGLQAYARRGTARPTWRAFGLRKLMGEDVFSMPWGRAMEVSAWMRHSAGTALAGEEIGEDFNAFVFGHAEYSGEASHRLSFVPVPSIHSKQNAGGRIRRVMVVEPIGSAGRVVELLADRWVGMRLCNEHGVEECILEPEDGRVTPLYATCAKIWRSVTPVVLHGFNSARGVVSVGKTEKLLLRAFEMAGRSEDEIESLAFQAAPLWLGTGSAKAIRVPKHLDGYPRYHVQVAFRQAVEGPVLAGIGRHYGIGLFASVE